MDDKSVLNSMLIFGKSLGKCAELELRMDGSIITESGINKIKSTLGPDDWEHITYMEKQIRPTRISGEYYYRKINGKETVCKSTLKRKKLLGDWYNLVLSSEVSVSYNVKLNSFSIKPIQKQRWSKTFDDFRIDITEIPENNNILRFVELEILSFDKLNIQKFFKTAQFCTLCMLNDKTFIPKTIRNILAKQSNTVIKKFKLNKPVTLTKSNIKDLVLSKKNYMMSAKVDGERLLLTIMGGYLCTLKPNLDRDCLCNVILHFTEHSKRNPIALDIEKINHDKYFILDVIIYNGKNLTRHKLPERLSYIKTFLSDIKPYLTQQNLFESKPYLPMNVFPTLSMFKKYENMMDGIVFTHGKQYHNKIYKWKHIGTTVDLEWNPLTKKLSCGNPPQEFDPTASGITNVLDPNNILDVTGIYEFNILERHTLVCTKKREDRIYGNNLTIVEKNIQDALGPDLLDGTPQTFFKLWINEIQNIMMYTPNFPTITSQNTFPNSNLSYTQSAKLLASQKIFPRSNKL
ncbi:hypothetical protein K7432_009864 [Basidiobolus ranarum]|uniref:Uncharacterized protein n=1 Tax=Basidiobolus ranarum TaxID=34480 RepID=A0ABR2WPL2_9FUNG